VRHLDRRAGAIYAPTVNSLNQTAQLHPVTDTNTPQSAPPKPGATVHPLGPVVYRIAAKRPARARLIAFGVLGGCAVLLSLAARITPDSSGMGSHKQLGYPSCTMLTLTGFPCPTCGMTTAFAHTVRGELLSAFHAQPAGFALALATILAACVSLGVAVTGKVWAVNWYRISPTRVTLAVVLLVLGGWVYKLAVGVISGTLPVGR